MGFSIADAITDADAKGCPEVTDPDNAAGAYKADIKKPRTDLVTWEGYDLITGPAMDRACSQYAAGPAALTHAALSSLLTWIKDKDTAAFDLASAAAAGLYAGQHLITGGQQPRGLLTPIMDCAPAILSVAEVLGFGAAKYPDRNWEHGMKYSRVIAAAERHALAFIGGEVLDRETNLPHVSHFNSCMLFLLTYEARGMGEKWDDRHTLTGGAA